MYVRRRRRKEDAKEEDEESRQPGFLKFLEMRTWSITSLGKVVFLGRKKVWLIGMQVSVVNMQVWLICGVDKYV